MCWSTYSSAIKLVRNILYEIFCKLIFNVVMFYQAENLINGSPYIFDVPGLESSLQLLYITGTMLLHYSKLPPLTLCVQYECETKPTPTSTF